jgi:hypothetical protein
MNYRYLSFGGASLVVVFAVFLLNDKPDERPLTFVQDSKVNVITQSVDKDNSADAINSKKNSIK